MKMGTVAQSKNGKKKKRKKKKKKKIEKQGMKGGQYPPPSFPQFTLRYHTQFLVGCKTKKELICSRVTLKKRARYSGGERERERSRNLSRVV